MILRTEVVDQAIDGDRRTTLVKDVVMTAGTPLGMVRKRLPPPAETRGTVLLIHGFAQNRYAWHTSRRSFSAFLADEGWDVFNCDLRGHGRSRRFQDSRPQILDDYIHEDLPRFAEEAARLSGHEQLFLVGHSMGGLISYCASATSLRDVTRGLVTLGAPYRFGLGSPVLKAFSALLRGLRFTGVLDANMLLPTRLLGRHFRKRSALWDSAAFPAPVRVWRPGSVERDLLDEYLEQSWDWTSLHVALDILQGGERVALRSEDGHLDYGAAFEWLETPLLVVSGDEDLLVPPASVRPAFDRSRSQDRTYRTFPLGHIDLIVGREATTTVWPLVGSWLERRA